jgi:hypothetical protein
MLSTPAGMPARMASSAAARAVSGVSSAGLMTTGQPAASAGATLRVIMASGKFQGVMAAHTPMGCLQHHQAAVVVELGQGLAVDALGFFGKPLDEAGAVGHFALGLAQDRSSDFFLPPRATPSWRPARWCRATTRR